MPSGLFQFDLESFGIDYSNPILNTRISVARPIALIDPIPDEYAHGVATERRPRPVLTEAKTGVIQWAFFHDYYNRLYLLPTRVDFGTISGVQTLEFFVWNAFLTTTTVQSITLEGGDGLTLDGPALPTSMKPLAIGEYTLTASEDGPPILNAVINFDIGVPETIPLPVVGVRAYLAPFKPNWRSPVKIDVEFKTDIIVSRSGQEQRRALRAKPRKRLEFTALAYNAKLRLVNEILDSAQTSIIIMPEFTRRGRVVSPMIGGALEAVVDTPVPPWIVPDAAVILGSGERFESRRVDSVVGNIVTFTSASVEPWVAGTLIYPALSGTLAQDLQAKRFTNTTSEIAIVYDVLPGSEETWFSPDVVETFNGREVFLKKPNWAENPSINYQHEWERVDYGYGVIARYHPIDFSTRLYRATYVGRTGHEAHAIREFFERMKGQRGEFYMPTWESDIIIKVPAQAATNTLRVSGTGLVSAYRESTVRKAVAVFLRDGTRYLNVVAEVFEHSDELGRDSVVNCVSPWPTTFNPSDVLFISWMPVWRHATDILSMQFLTGEVAQIQLTLKTLEDLPV
jgi:hypothetical protein